MIENVNLKRIEEEPQNGYGRSQKSYCEEGKTAAQA